MTRLCRGARLRKTATVYNIYPTFIYVDIFAKKVIDELNYGINTDRKELALYKVSIPSALKNVYAKWILLLLLLLLFILSLLLPGVGIHMGKQTTTK